MNLSKSGLNHCLKPKKAFQATSLTALRGARSISSLDMALSITITRGAQKNSKYAFSNILVRILKLGKLRRPFIKSAKIPFLTFSKLRPRLMNKRAATGRRFPTKSRVGKNRGKWRPENHEKTQKWQFLWPLPISPPHLQTRETEMGRNSFSKDRSIAIASIDRDVKRRPRFPGFSILLGNCFQNLKIKLSTRWRSKEEI